MTTSNDITQLVAAIKANALSLIAGKGAANDGPKISLTDGRSTFTPCFESHSSPRVCAASFIESAVKPLIAALGTELDAAADAALEEIQAFVEELNLSHIVSI